MIEDLEKLKEDYKEIGDKIRKIERTAWYKILKPTVIEHDGTKSMYEIVFVNEDKLERLKDYVILKTFKNKEDMIKKIKKDS